MEDSQARRSARPAAVRVGEACRAIHRSRPFVIVGLNVQVLTRRRFFRDRVIAVDPAAQVNEPAPF